MTEDIKLVSGDALEVSKTLKDDSIDLIFTDPPYGGTSYMDGLDDEYKNELLDQFHRILRTQGNLIVFCSHYEQFDWHKRMIDSEFIFKQPLVWVYANPTARMYKSENQTKFLPAYDSILFMVKDKNPFFLSDWKLELNWFRSPSSTGFLRGREGVPTAKYADAGLIVTPKPLKIARILVKRLCPPQGVVFDPFMGYATFGIPCIEQRKRFFGVEKNTKVFEIAKQRLSKFSPIRSLTEAFG